jgi:monovalent cation/proton antiporter MnhG/PhaG subunit
MSVIQAVGSFLMIAGTVLSVLAAWGVLDFPSALARMHAATKSASLGLGLIAVGAGLGAASWGLTGIGVLVAAFLFMTAPITGHLLGRAAYAAGQIDGLVHDGLAGEAPPKAQITVDTDRTLSPIRWIALVLVWVLLWRDLSAGTLLGGAVVASLIELIRRADQRRDVNLVGLVRFFANYAWLVVASNLRVAWEVITPNNDQIEEAIVAVPLQTRSVATALLVANAISYTPGSLSMELSADPWILYVHVLHFTSVEDVQESVSKLEVLAMRAISNPVPVDETSPPS